METVEDAQNYLIQLLRNYVKDPKVPGCSNSFFDLYLPLVVECLDTRHNSPLPNITVLDPDRVLVLMMDAAWELCRLGVLRPSINTKPTGVITPDLEGTGYSLTELGKKRLQDEDWPLGELMPAQMVSLFEAYLERFGQRFVSRALEAVKCYRGSAYLATCTMAGAAAEAILLEVAIARHGDEGKAVATYQSQGGRQKTIKSITGQLKSFRSEKFKSLMEILSYWRDNASHGHDTRITEVEAHHSLLVLVRFSQFVDDEWENLVAVPK